VGGTGQTGGVADDTRLAFVHEIELDLADGTDPAAPGAAVTTALCGHWEHEGPCRWPHNNALDASAADAVLHTLFIAPSADEAEVRARIDRALEEGRGWLALSGRPRPVAARERPLAARLAATLPS